MSDFFDSKNYITKNKLQEYVSKFNFGIQAFLFDTQPLVSLRNSILQKLNTIFDECDTNKTTTLDSVEEVSIFFDKVNNTSFELPNVIFEPHSPKGNIINPGGKIIVDETNIVNYRINNLASFIYEDDNDNKQLESVGNFSYDSADNSETLKAFDDHYNKNSFKYDKSKQILLKKIREMIGASAISFEDGLSKSELVGLFGMDESSLQSLVKKEYSTEILKQTLDMDMQIVDCLLNNDFSAFDNLVKNIYNYEDLIVINDFYKEKTGQSIYNGLINKYENKEISEELFNKNLKKLLKSYKTDKFALYDKTNATLFNQIYDDIQNKKINLEQLKTFDFDNYIDVLFRHYSTSRFKENDEFVQEKECEKIDLTKTQIAECIPVIVDNRIAENIKEQKFNGKKYQINYFSNKIIVTDSNNKQYTIDYVASTSKWNDFV